MVISLNMLHMLKLLAYSQVRRDPGYVYCRVWANKENDYRAFYLNLQARLSPSGFTNAPFMVDVHSSLSGLSEREKTVPGVW